MPRKKKEPQKNINEEKELLKTPSVEEQQKPEEEAVEEKKTQGQLFIGTGRRKTAVARVFITEEKGDFTVNDMPLTDYFKSATAQAKWVKPFHIIGISHPKSKFNATIKVRGAGKAAQLDAVVHGLSRALAKMSEEYHISLAKQGLMTRDPRMVERKKPFLHKARKRPQYSKR